MILTQRESIQKNFETALIVAIGLMTILLISRFIPTNHDVYCKAHPHASYCE